jgi:hypothetical protein
VQWFGMIALSYVVHPSTFEVTSPGDSGKRPPRSSGSALPLIADSVSAPTGLAPPGKGTVARWGKRRWHVMQALEISAARRSSGQACEAT